MAPNEHPRTSVIVPARDAGRTLAETLDSLLAQSDTDWQALLIDDGSTDDTAALIQRYAQRDARFVALQGSGAGASAARNVGLSHAAGRRLLFLDSDDWIDARFLEVMNSAIDAAPGAVAAYCNYRRVMPDGSQTPARSSPHIAQAPCEAFARSCATAIHTVVIERALISRIGGFDPSLRTCEDWDLWQRAARMGGNWVHVDRALSYYRSSATSLSQDIDRMLVDARTVIARGFAPDGRLADTPPTSIGGACDTDSEPAALALAYFALWCAAFDCGRGGNGGDATLQHLGALPGTPDGAHSIVGVLFDGVMVGLRTAPSRIASQWPAFGTSITALVAHLGRVWNDPVAARRIQYRFERLVLDHDDLAQARPLFLTLGMRVDLREPLAVTPPPGVDRLYIYLCDGPEVCALLDLGVLGAVTTREWIELALTHLGDASVRAVTGGSLGPRLRRHKIGQIIRELGRAPRTALRPSEWRQLRSIAARRALLSAAGPERAPRSHRYWIDKLQMEAEATTSLRHRAGIVERQHVAEPGSSIVANGDRQAYWEQFFQRADPWNYGSAYEQEKYARQLKLIAGLPISQALELACAEGRFTEKLAPHVGHLLATDISATALARARERCVEHANIEFRQLDLLVDALPQALDLIVCSEVLYYVDDEATLAQVARRLAASLRPGGRLLTAHAFLLRDDRSHTGFDWEHSFGARAIARTFATVPELAHERSLDAELYGIDVFVRVGAPQPRPEPAVEHEPITTPLDIEVARHIVWGGAVALRSELAKTEARTQAPVLLYHRVAGDGPAALARYRVAPEMFREQMRWLRRNGYHSIVSEELCWFLDHQHSFVGRPVVITFDDGFQDFADAAWPILHSHDFRAEVFIVSDLVGQASTWDRRVGEPAPLMDSQTLVRLASEGASFGSHLASHRAADGLSTRELTEELTRSRASLQRWIDRPIESLATPFGLSDGRLPCLAAECGYRIGYGTRDSAAQLQADRFDLPRIEVRGDWTLDTFIARLEACR